jgi:ABC-2 type transport system ATP-binding protein
MEIEKTVQNRNKLVVTGVSKKIGETEILAPVSFSMEEGECFGILGENGSGKTTLLRIITGLVSPTSGNVTINGFSPHTNPRKALSNAGALIGIPGFYPHISAYNNLRLLYGGDTEPAEDLIKTTLEEVGLIDDMEKKAGAYSRGMLQRLGIGLAFMNDRPFSLLDEPTQGVDDIWVERLIKAIRKRLKSGRGFILVSHNFDFIMELCGPVLILDAGKTVYDGPLNEIAEFPYYFHTKFSPEDKGEKLLQRLDFVHRYERGKDWWELTLQEEDSARLVKSFVDEGIELYECGKRHYSISDFVAHHKNGNSE